MSPEDYFEVQPQIEEVSYDEFRGFILRYPRVLDSFAEHLEYNFCDSELAPYPFNVVAYTDTWENKRIYFIMKNYAEVFASRREVKNEG